MNISVSITLRGRLTTKFVGVSQIFTQGPHVFGLPGHPTRVSGGIKWEFIFQSSRFDRISQIGNERFDTLKRGKSLYSTGVDHGSKRGFKVCEEERHIAVGRKRKPDLSASWWGNMATKGHAEGDKRVVKK
jgi:hypothetical protein